MLGACWKPWVRSLDLYKIDRVAQAYIQEVEAGNQGAHGNPGLLSELVVCLNNFIPLGPLLS